MKSFRTIRALLSGHCRRITAFPSPQNLSRSFTTSTPFPPPPLISSPLQYFFSSAAASASARFPLRQYLKFGALGILAPVAAIGCITCAYTLDEVDDMTKGFIVRNCHTTRKERKFYSLTFLRIGESIRLQILDLAASSIQLYVIIRWYIEDYIKDNRQCTSTKLLPDVDKSYNYTLVLDLTDTLVHSDWICTIWEHGNRESYMRPGMKDFLKNVREMGYEPILYTDGTSLNVEDFESDKEEAYFVERLTMRATIKKDGNYYRDLSRLNRDPSKIVYVSAHALENCLQPENCVPITPWNRDMEDTTLLKLQYFLHFVACERPDDIRPLLSRFNSEGKDVADVFKDHEGKAVAEDEGKAIAEVERRKTER